MQDGSDYLRFIESAYTNRVKLLTIQLARMVKYLSRLVLHATDILTFRFYYLASFIVVINKA